MDKLKNYTFGFLLLAPICTLFILLGIYPYRPSSILSWSVLLLISVPFTLTFEFIGEKIFNSEIITNLSKWSRIVLGVILLIVIFAIIILLFNYGAKPYLSKWSI